MAAIVSIAAGRKTTSVHLLGQVGSWGGGKEEELCLQTTCKKCDGHGEYSHERGAGRHGSAGGAEPRDRHEEVRLPEIRKTKLYNDLFS